MRLQGNNSGVAPQYRPLKKSLLFSSPSLSLRSPHPKPFASLSFSSSSMDPTATCPTTVEHVVLFKVRDATDPTKIDSLLSNLRSLTSLDLATHLTAGPILRLRSSAASALGFTHLLHSRYPSKPDLAAYSAHPDHISVVKSHVLPICDDIMAVDWLAHAQLPAPSPGSVLRLTLAKPKEEAATARIVEVIEGINQLIGNKAEQVSVGENFSPARAKGYTVGFISVFKSVEELDALMEEDKEVVEAQKEKVRPLLEDLIVLDYVVPHPAPASL